MAETKIERTGTPRPDAMNLREQLDVLARTWRARALATTSGPVGRFGEYLVVSDRLGEAKAIDLCARELEALLAPAGKPDCIKCGGSGDCRFCDAPRGCSCCAPEEGQ